MTSETGTATTIEIPLDEFTVRALQWGPVDGPLAILLHGFPDSAGTWRHLGPVLAERGYRVVAPYNRGYAPTDLAPDDTYQLGALVADVIAVHEALGGDERAVIVGHDWGAGVCNGVVHHAPERFAAAVIMAVPPPPALFALRSAPLILRQLPHSWYMSVLSVPVFSDLLGDKMIRLLWRMWAPGYDGAADRDAAIAAMPDRAHRRAAYSYYRALWNPLYRASRYDAQQRSAVDKPLVPTLYLHGATDECVLPALAARVDDVLPAGSRSVIVDDAGHFLHLEQPETVNALIADFLPR